MLTALVVAALAVLVPAVLRPPQQSAQAAGVQLSARDTGPEAPVIGDGPLTRVMRVEYGNTPGAAAVAVDPYTGARVQLSAATTRGLDGAPYLIQRFGYGPAIQRTVSLTFDDGPDALVTPQLLDLLSRERVPATFFVLGRHAVEQPELVRRMVREGHEVGSHTLTHPNLDQEDELREQVELVSTDRVLRALTGRSSALWRMPYDDSSVSGRQDSIQALLRAQRLGYLHAGYDVDSRDWVYNADPNGRAEDIPLPTLDGRSNLTVLLHDAGGPNRARTVQYVARLIAHARAAGYTFHTMPQANPAISTAVHPSGPEQLGDQAALAAATMVFAWPDHLLTVLFVLALVLVVGLGVVNVGLAVGRHRRRAGQLWPGPQQTPMAVTVALAAYNEEAVIARTLRSILASDYPIGEVIVVDDGSSDGTSQAVEQVAALDPRVRLIRQDNLGKATALNRGLRAATGQVVVTLDADTVMRPQAIGNLVRHFAADHTGRLGAVAGVVRVGNRRRNLLTRWQALEYLTQIGLDRAAQDRMRAIPVVPGACAAWRTEAIVQAGGYSQDTLAEDCDLALTLHRNGWRITQDDEAVALTEAPETVPALLKQRIRWTFGTMQAMYKHRSLMFRPGTGALGWFVLPHYLLNIVVPVVCVPFVAVMTVVTAVHEGIGLVAGYAAVFGLFHLATAAVAVRLMGESWRVLAVIPVYRLIYDPLRAYLLYASLLRAVKGVRVGWNKLSRTGSLDGVGDAAEAAVVSARRRAPRLPLPVPAGR